MQEEFGEYRIEQLTELIDHVNNRMQVYITKEKKWGIDEEDVKKYNKLQVKYLQYYYELCDEVFINYIEPLLYNDNIIRIKSILLDKYKWNGKLYFLDKDITNFINKVSSVNLEEFIDLIKELEKEELNSLIYTYDKELNKLFCELNCRKEIEDDFTKKYIKYKYNTILVLLK